MAFKLLIVFLAGFWIISGVLFLFFPRFLRWRFKRKGVRWARRILYLLGLPLLFSYAAAVTKWDGIRAKVVGFSVFFLLCNLFWLSRRFLAQKVAAFFGEGSSGLFRLAAAAYIGIGVWLILSVQ